MMIESATPNATPSEGLPSPAVPVDAGGDRIFGIPFGKFGLFATVLFSFALAFASFFAATFVSIFAILAYNKAGHHAVDFADAYKRIALPVGLVVLMLALATLGFFWIRRKVRGS